MGGTVGCIACDLHAGRRDLPGGIILQTQAWNVSHCVGPLGVGTLIVTPRRHVLHVWDLDPTEQGELGPLMRNVAEAVRAVADPGQVYVCLWSHEGGRAGHIHFVVQPVPDLEPDAPRGPTLQAHLFEAGVLPDRSAVEVFSNAIRRHLDDHAGYGSMRSDGDPDVDGT